MKPFLLLAIRAEDAAADNEYDSFLTLAGLKESELRRVRLEQRALGDVDLRDWSGVMLGGGPFNYTCLLYTSPSPRDRQKSRMPSSA